MASTSPTSPQRSKSTTDILNFECPFKDCSKKYTSSSKLKNHLRTIRGSGGDSQHPFRHEEWDRLDVIGYLRLINRPGDLTAEEKERRKIEAQRKHYRLHKQDILKKHKERTKRINSTLEVAKDLSTYAKSAYTREQKIRLNVEDRSKILQTVFGASAQYEIHSFIKDLDSTPTFETFPRIVAFYLQQSDFPDLNSMIPEVSRIMQYIPGESQFRKVSRILHPDMGNTTTLQSTLASAFDLWKPVLQDKELATAILPSDDNAPEFIARGEKYQLLLDLYWISVKANMEAAQLMSPQMLSLATLYKTLAVLEEEEKLLKSDEDTGSVENMLQKVMEMPDVNTNTKRQRKNVSHQSHANSRTNDETSDSDATVDDLDGSTNPPLINTRTLRPRN